MGGFTPGSVGSTVPAYRSSRSAPGARPPPACATPAAGFADATRTCCHSGTGRRSLTTTVVSPRTISSQSPNSSALDTVADRDTSCTSSGRWMITSSHTGPRNRSAR